MRTAFGISLLFFVTLLSCNKPPEACIISDSGSTTVGTAVTMSASCSKRALSYIWSFEGPAGSNMNNVERSEEEITIAFDVAGSYTVTLEAYEKFSWLGQMGSTTTSVTVN